MKLLLIDGNSMLFRAFYATIYGKAMTTSSGLYTNAVYGFAVMLNKALSLIKPEYCAVAFDKGKHTFRHEIDPEYKAGRKQTPAELVGQFPLIREMLTAYNIKWFEYDDIEADDVVGTLAKRYPVETCILTSDRDMLQLIDDTTSIYLMKKGITEMAVMDEKALFEEWTLKPYQIIDYKGLAGDASDNIKGVPGIGDKTAVKLLNQYDTCEGIYEHLDEIKGKLRDKLNDGKESCFISKQLARIKTDVDIDIDLADLKLSIDDKTRNDFFHQYEMKSLVTKEEKPVIAKKEANIVKTVSASLLKKPFIYFVSNEQSYYERDFEAVGIYNEEGFEYIKKEDFLLDHDLLSFLSSSKEKIVYDLKAVLHLADYWNLKIGGHIDDVMLMGFLVNNNNNTPELLANAYGHRLGNDLKGLFGTEKKPLLPKDEDLASYAYDFCSFMHDIYLKTKNELRDKGMEALYEDVELKLSYVLYEMEKEGIYCDITELDKIAEATLLKMQGYERNIYACAGHEFNINSPKQLKEVLFNELDLPDYKKGSTNAEALQKISSYHPIIDHILNFRKYSKLYSTYAEGLKKYIGNDNRIHTIFSQNITATGRLSSYDPNLQNISVRDDEGREIRKAFKPGNDSVLISSDYSQVELRVLASLADEEKMIEAFNSGIDIHTKTAMDIFNVKKEDVTANVRRNAKAVNFGVVYGISDFGLANQTQLSFSDAKNFIEDYFRTYPNIKKYLDEQVSFCKENGYVTTILGRRRYIREINDKNFMVREFGKRAAMNSTIQGSAADIIKLAMIKATEEIKARGLKSKLLLQVHDELIFEVRNEELKIMKELIANCMSSAYQLKARLDCSMAIGQTWYEAK